MRFPAGGAWNEESASKALPSPILKHRKLPDCLKLLNTAIMALIGRTLPIKCGKCGHRQTLQQLQFKGGQVS